MSAPISQVLTSICKKYILYAQFAGDSYVTRCYVRVVCVCVYLQDTAGDVGGYLGVRCVLRVFTLRGEVMFQTGLPQPHQSHAVSLDGAGLSNGRGDACDADLHHGLVIVIGQIILTVTGCTWKESVINQEHKCEQFINKHLS